MKKIAIFVCIILIILLNASIIKREMIKPDFSYDDYIVELDENYNGDKSKILNRLNEEILDNSNDKVYRGINLFVRQYYFYLWRDNENLIKYADETERYLRKYNMEEVLLDFYGMMSSRYIGDGNYNMGYIYIDKGENTAKRIYEKTESKEILSSLVAIKYLKAVIALDIGMEREADNVFNEAEELRKIGIREREDIYTDILLYYHSKEEYNLAIEYAVKLIKLIEAKYKENENNNRNYIRAKIILAENYIYTGQINKSINIVNELINYKNIVNDNVYIYEMYFLYSEIYRYYGNTQESIKCLKLAYDKIKSTENNLAKTRIIQSIIKQLQLLDDKDELIHWYKIENEIYRSSQSQKDTQNLLSQIIDTDLENANYDIEILQNQKINMVYLIISLSSIIMIVIIIIVIERKRKNLLKENINILEKNITINQKYYENIKNNNENIKRIKHDMKNHMLVINRLILKKEYDTITNYMKSIEVEIDNASVDTTTNNKIIDAIIYSKIETCRLEKIDLELDVKLPEKIEVEDFDICVIYGNILDNSIEACKGINNEKINRYIKFKSIVKGDYLFINIKNSYRGTLNIKEGTFITTKNDKENHGMGIKNIKKSVKKYAGEIKINYTNKEFHTSIIIPIIK